MPSTEQLPVDVPVPSNSTIAVTALVMLITLLELGALLLQSVAIRAKNHALSDFTPQPSPRGSFLYRSTICSTFSLVDRVEVVKLKALGFVNGARPRMPPTALTATAKNFFVELDNLSNLSVPFCYVRWHECVLLGDFLPPRPELCGVELANQFGLCVSRANAVHCELSAT